MNKLIKQKKIKNSKSQKIKEIGGPSGPEPTRYGDWEKKGICYDFLVFYSLFFINSSTTSGSFKVEVSPIESLHYKQLF